MKKLTRLQIAERTVKVFTAFLQMENKVRETAHSNIMFVRAMFALERRYRNMLEILHRTA